MIAKFRRDRLLSWGKDNFSWLLVSLGVVALFLFYPFILTGLAKWPFMQPFFRTMKSGGSIGDSFGALTSFLTACSVIYLARSFLLTQSSVNSTLVQQQKQQFISQFFEWQKYNHSIVEQFSIPENGSSDQILTGRNGLHHAWKDMVEQLNYKFETDLYNSNMYLLLPLTIAPVFWCAKKVTENESVDASSKSAVSKIGLRTALEIYSSCYQRHEYQLDYWFRNLYRLLVWVDTQQYLSNAERWEYIRIARAQLSWTEMAWLFLNALTDNGKKFKPLIEKYALFDNLAMGEENLNSHVLLFCKGKFEPSAFSSALAKNLLEIPQDF
jgi:hypothetical protein